jgi:hypothetical protein|tara:strand:- start:1046 stop:1255 length:210 start_codon:yes stop_codon:yes gene_type:complete
LSINLTAAANSTTQKYGSRHQDVMKAVKKKALLQKLPVHHYTQLHDPIGNHAENHGVENNAEMGFEPIH